MKNKINKQFLFKSRYLFLLALFFVFAVSFGFSSNIAKAQVATTSVSVSIQDNQFFPQDITVPAGYTVAWTNNGSNTHTVTSDTGVFDSGPISTNSSFDQVFLNTGAFPYHDTYYGGTGGMGMSGVVTVVAQGQTTYTSTTSVAPVISSVATMVGSDGTTAVITWATDQPSSSQIMYGTIASNLTSSTTHDTNSVTSHSVTLSGLTPNTNYYFQIMTSNPSGMNTTGVEQTLMTTPNATNNPNATTGTSTLTPAQIQTFETELQQIAQAITVLQQEVTQYLASRNIM